MINQRLAFNRFTTAKHYIEVYQPGHYDSKNNWVDDSWGPKMPFMCTPIGYGDRDSGTNGQQLSATDVGERQPSFMQVHSINMMPMKSHLTIYGIVYKVVSKSDYTDAGFQRVIATKVLEK